MTDGPVSGHTSFVVCASVYVRTYMVVVEMKDVYAVVCVLCVCVCVCVLTCRLFSLCVHVPLAQDTFQPAAHGAVEGHC